MPLLPPPLAQVPPPAAIASAPELIILRPSDVDCGGTLVVPTHRELPIPAASASVDSDMLRPLTMTFSIDQRGRPIDIRQAGGGPQWVDTSDAAPALAAWQFAAGAPRERCTMTYTINHLRFPDVPIDDAYRAFAFRRGNTQEMGPFYNLTIPAGSDCFDPWPDYRLIALPDYHRLQQAPGTVSYAMVGFDIDAAGRTGDIHLIGGDRDSPIAEAGIAAVKKSRFVDGAKHRCALPFSLTPHTPMAAPADDPARHPPSDPSCAAIPEGWTYMPPLTFPAGFERRSIEGWATIRYDVAPWGETGNVSVVKSEPAAAFGDRAAEIIGGARRPASKLGASGCIQQVAFAIRPRGG